MKQSIVIKESELKTLVKKCVNEVLTHVITEQQANGERESGH